MDQENIRNLIIERFNSLQPEIQDAILDTAYEEKLSKISEKYNLSKEQWYDFEIHTTLVMLGNTHPEDYLNALIESLKISNDTALKIVTEVNETILKDILPILKQNFIDDDTEEEEIKAVPLPPPTTNKEIPIPVPAQKIEKITAPISNSQNGIFEKAGIEMVEDEGAHLAIVENKLNKPTVKMQSVKDYSLPKLSREKPNDDHTKPSSDPYHEAI